MLLSPGTRLGPYEIVSPAGAGGMGQVYRARDSRLGRDVAIKVLPAEFASDPDWRRRLEREARSISSLSHPNIAPLYDIGQQDGIDFLVMEYLEGETLAARLARGPLPLEQTLRHGVEIAAALAAAHRRGIVHRDLKPGNIMLTRTGARLLDFGLAKPSASHPGSAVDATVSAPITAHGTLVGTFQYMAPEQVEGREADERSDIFAFGAVLYEMATGRRAFDGRTTASVIAAILEREPAPLSTIQPLTPLPFEDLVRRCLAKDPDERWQSAHDIRIQLEGMLARDTDRAVRPMTLSTRARIAAAALLAALFLAAFLLGQSSAPAPGVAPLARASLLPPPAHSYTPNDFAISPDGRRVAFVAAGADGVATLWVRSLDAAEPTEIGGSEGASWPFWSPDSRQVAFFARGHLLKVEPGVTGLQSICPTPPHPSGGAWSAGDVLVFSPDVVGPLYRVDARGGTATPVTTLPEDMPGEAHRFPQFLPDGKRFLYLATWTNQQHGGIYLGSVDAAAAELVSSEIRSRVILAGGHLLYVEAGTLYARPLDARTGRLAGSPRTVLRNELVFDWRFGEVPLAASDNGVLVYQPRNYSQLAWFDRQGRELGLVGPRGYSAPALSPDDRRVAVSYDSRGTGQTSLWLHDLQRNIPVEFAANGTHTAHGWSGDGRWIGYSAQQGTHQIYRRATDGSGREDMLVQSAAHLLFNSYSPDGRSVLFMDFLKGSTELRAVDVESRQVDLISMGAEGVYSPDGAWVAYLDVGLGSVVLTSPGRKEKITVTGTGSQVRWRRDDMSEIFYIDREKRMMVVPLTRRDGLLEPGTPAVLFQTRIVQPRLILFQYDVTRDGQRFLINSLPREDAAAPLTVLFNWTGTLSR